MITDDSNVLVLSNKNKNSDTPTTLLINTNTGDRATLRLRREGKFDLTTPNTVFGRIVFEKNDPQGIGANSIIVGGSNFLLLGNRENTEGHFFKEEGCFVIANFKNFGVGTKTPSPHARLDINGIMKLRIQITEPDVGEVGMLAMASGKQDEWDPNNLNSGVPYPVFFDGVKWREIKLGE